MKGAAACWRKMASSWEQATKPPLEGMALASEPVQISTSDAGIPKCSSVPRPRSPRTPVAWDSSTMRKQPCSFLRATNSGRRQMSPSIEKTPSAMIKVRLAGSPDSSSWRRESGLLCAKRCTVAPASRQASTRLRWERASRITRSMGESTAETTARLAAYPELKVMASAVPLKAASCFSMRWCRSMVPVSMRTPPVPVPYLRMAAMAHSSMRGSPIRPR